MFQKRLEEVWRTSPRDRAISLGTGRTHGMGPQGATHAKVGDLEKSQGMVGGSWSWLWMLCWGCLSTTHQKRGGGQHFRGGKGPCLGCEVRTCPRERAPVPPCDGRFLQPSPSRHGCRSRPSPARACQRDAGERT